MCVVLEKNVGTGVTETFQGFVGTGIDVTEQEQLTEELRPLRLALLLCSCALPRIFGPRGEKACWSRRAAAPRAPRRESYD